MTYRIVALLVTVIVFAASCAKHPAETALEAVDFTKVEITDDFWNPRIRANAEVTIPHALAKCEDEGRMDNFRRAAGLEEGQWRGHFGFDDSDLYKVLEGMAYTYNINHDEGLRLKMDELIGIIAAAQCEDGYLYTAFQLKARDYTEVYCTYDKGRYDRLVESHEFYNMGHMYEAAVAHYLATGQDNFLNVAIKSADHIYDNFGPGKTEAIPGHQEIEIGLMKLARITGKSKYAELAKLFLDRRGKGNYNYNAYYQDDEPVTEQKYARGHAVRANYMYSAMTDVAILLGDNEYTAAIDTLWNDVLNTKIYVTGGLGARYAGESYGPAYELPNASYCETCAAIAGVYWNQRMFLLHGESKYADVLERILYNALIAGISLDGNHFFYPNPMVADGVCGFNKGNRGRSEWFYCSCCPSNDVRFMSSISGYVYSACGNAIYQNLYMSNKADISLDGINVRLSQTSGYPWDGRISTTLGLDVPAVFSMRMRIPSWSKGQPMPGKLYSYIDSTAAEVSITVNGKPVRWTEKDGYADIRRRWKDGDVINVEFEMPVREVVADNRVKADRGLVAIERGPLVYCFEEVDNGEIVKHSGGKNEDSANGAEILIRLKSEFKPVYDANLLGGVVKLTDGSLTAVPYCLWDNRGDGQMSVWLKSGNPVFDGAYADPEGAVFDGQYWIYPTTSLDFKDQLYMDAFSSADLVHWTKHENVLTNKDVSWLWQALWAPSVVEKDGKYYFYFGGNDVHEGEVGGIGVAVSDSPAGPFKDALGKPLIGEIHNGAQPIDQFAFRDDDGKWYMYYGGWHHCNVVRLNDDMVSLGTHEDGSTYKEITPEGYVEGPYMLKKGGKYYFMWSEGSWTEDDYCVAYAIADSPLGPFKRIGKILQADPEIGTGAGHHSILKGKGEDEWYIVYHRHPLGAVDGNDRVVCIDRMFFESDGMIRPVKITTEGI